MLAFPNRLPASDLRAVMRQGKSFFSGPLQLILSPTKSSPPRFAFVVSTKIDKRATARNRMKRLLREATQKLLPSLKSTADGVFITKKGLPDTQQKVNALVEDIFRKASLL